MRRKRKVLLMTMIVIMVVCLMAIVSSCGTEEQSSIQLPDEAAETIQFNGIKIHSNTGDYDKFAKSLESDLQLVNPRSQTVQRGETYHVVTLTFEDGTKETFYFFQTDENNETWYVETMDGTIYQNAEFITEYINTSSQVQSTDTVNGALELSDPNKLNRAIQLTLQLEDLGVSYSATDLRAAFAMEMQNQMELWDTEEDAAQSTRTQLTWKLDRYQYAIENGYRLTEEELDARIEELDTIMKSASNFEELEAFYEEQGTTYDAHRKSLREYDRIVFTEEALYQAIYEKFRHGEDQIGDKVCEDAVEYWNYYLTDIIYPEMEDYNKETLAPLLDEAETFYYAHFSQKKE